MAIPESRGGEDYPDFTSAVTLLGVDADGDPVLVLVDSAGNLSALLRGEDAAETVRTVKVDDTGQLYAVLRGADDVDVAVDAEGYLTTLAKGIDGASDLHTLAVDASGQLVMVPRGQSGNYMAIDANGYMTAVLKGVRDSVLTTIGVDADGRIEAFGLDAEDQWGSVLKTGNSELAARLGSPVAWDWRGNVLYAQDFGRGYGPVISQTSGTGGAIALGVEYPGESGYALKLTAGSTASHYARIQLSTGANPATRVGAAFRFTISTNTEYIQIQLVRQKGAESPWAYGRIDVANEQLQVYASPGGWTDVQAVDVNLSAFCYGWLKLVIDQESGKYERILYNDVEVDVSAYSYPTTTTSVVGALFAEFQNTGRSGNNDVVYLDQVILTVNEPGNS